MRQLLVLALVALLCLQGSLLVNSQHTGTKCKRIANEPGCVCDHSDGIIDLRQFANRNNTPSFTNLIDPNGYHYTFNPCYTFSKGCDNVYICQQDKFTSTTYYPIAGNGTEEIYTDTDGSIYLYYTVSLSQGYMRYARVYLDCDPTVTGYPKFTVYGDTRGIILHYEFRMRHAGVCPKSNSTTTPPPTTLNPTTVPGPTTAPWVYFAAILGILGGMSMVIGMVLCCLVGVLIGWMKSHHPSNYTQLQ